MRNDAKKKSVKSVKIKFREFLQSSTLQIFFEFCVSFKFCFIEDDVTAK